MPRLLRKADLHDLSVIIAWAAREGWNPGVEDAEVFYAADPEGFFIVESDGKPIAGLSLVRYGDDYAFLGFYLVHPDYRGQGIGYALWQEAIAKIGNRTIGLDGVVAQQENYRRSGFVYAHANIRHGGRVECAEPADAALVSVSPKHAALIADYDAKHNPVRRDTFLRGWLKTTDTRRSFALIDDGDVRGYGTIRACEEGHKIGGLFAENETVVDLLFRKLVASVGGGQIFLDIPEPNEAAHALCRRYELKPVFETARMYRGAQPNLPLAQIYGVTTFELG